MRWITSAAINLAALTTIALFYKSDAPSIEPSVSKISITENSIDKRDKEYKKELMKLSVYSNTLEAYAKQNSFNTQYCFLIDMKLPSGRNRFFVYDIQKNAVLEEGLVAHGSGSDTGGQELFFSNTPNSNCTSLGKYKIGVSYNGQFGLAFKLHGLDNTNDKAYERAVVLHSHSCVPASEVEPAEICRSWGCPTVAPAFLTTLKTYLDKAGKPVLMWIFY